MNISLCYRDNYLVVSLKEILTDTEFVKFEKLIVNKASEEPIAGLIIDLEVLDIIDSFTSRILQNIAFLVDKMEIPLILTGIKPVVAEVMKRQGLRFSDVSINNITDLSNGILQVNNHRND